jgi:hypothetical protein
VQNAVIAQPLWPAGTWRELASAEPHAEGRGKSLVMEARQPGGTGVSS